jgi:DNA-binding response OmpR family regulator
MSNRALVPYWRTWPRRRAVGGIPNRLPGVDVVHLSPTDGARMRILVIEDEPLLADAVRKGLTLESFAVDVARDGEAALEKAALTAYDAVVLDRDLPGMHGDEVCRRLVAAPDAPRILMLTAAATLADRVTGLELGADDYLVKPFEFEELVARLRALGRRTRPPARPCGSARASGSTRSAVRSTARAAWCASPARSSPCSPC